MHSIRTHKFPPFASYTHFSSSNSAMERQYSTTFPKSSVRNPPSFQESVHFKGLIWPPRFYSCIFCRREFRSSQALGGHMNVHRRDRAKLKQVYSPTSPPVQLSPDMLKDSAIFFRDNNFTGLQFPSLVSAGDHEIQEPLFKDNELLDETAVSCKRIKKSDRNLPCLRGELLTDCKKISRSMEDVDLELRLGSYPTPSPPRGAKVEKSVS